MSNHSPNSNINYPRFTTASSRESLIAAARVDPVPVCDMVIALERALVAEKINSDGLMMEKDKLESENASLKLEVPGRENGSTRKGTVVARPNELKDYSQNVKENKMAAGSSRRLADEEPELGKASGSGKGTMGSDTRNGSPKSSTQAIGNTRKFQQEGKQDEESTGEYEGKSVTVQHIPEFRNLRDSLTERGTNPILP